MSLKTVFSEKSSTDSQKCYAAHKKSPARVISKLQANFDFLIETGSIRRFQCPAITTLRSQSTSKKSAQEMLSMNQSSPSLSSQRTPFRARNTLPVTAVHKQSNRKHKRDKKRQIKKKDKKKPDMRNQ